MRPTTLPKHSAEHASSVVAQPHLALVDNNNNIIIITNISQTKCWKQNFHFHHGTLKYCTSSAQFRTDIKNWLSTFCSQNNEDHFSLLKLSMDSVSCSTSRAPTKDSTLHALTYIYTY